MRPSLTPKLEGIKTVFDHCRNDAWRPSLTPKLEGIKTQPTL